MTHCQFNKLMLAGLSVRLVYGLFYCKQENMVENFNIKNVWCKPDVSLLSSISKGIISLKPWGLAAA